MASSGWLFSPLATAFIDLEAEKITPIPGDAWARFAASGLTTDVLLVSHP
jgi:hypothetical protein